MEDILKLIEGYGLPLVLLLAAIYALYKFMNFSLYEVKREFSTKHDITANKMDEVKDELSQLKDKLNTVLEFVKK